MIKSLNNKLDNLVFNKEKSKSLIFDIYIKGQKNILSLVGATGFEPVTPAVSRQCSTAELRTQKLINYSKLKINL